MSDPMLFVFGKFLEEFHRGIGVPGHTAANPRFLISSILLEDLVPEIHRGIGVFSHVP